MNVIGAFLERFMLEQTCKTKQQSTWTFFRFRSFLVVQKLTNICYPIPRFAPTTHADGSKKAPAASSRQGGTGARMALRTQSTKLCRRTDTGLGGLLAATPFLSGPGVSHLADVGSLDNGALVIR